MAKNGFSMSNRIVVETIDAAKKITVDDCGKTFLLDNAAGLTASLPTASVAQSGWNCTFIVTTQTTSNNSYKVVSPSDDTNALMIGAMFCTAELPGSELALAEVTGAGSATKAFYLESTKAGGMQGSQVDVRTDGTSWYVHGQLHATGTLDIDSVFRNS